MADVLKPPPSETELPAGLLQQIDGLSPDALRELQQKISKLLGEAGKAKEEENPIRNDFLIRAREFLAFFPNKDLSSFYNIQKGDRPRVAALGRELIQLAQGHLRDENFFTKEFREQLFVKLQTAFLRGDRSREDDSILTADEVRMMRLLLDPLNTPELRGSAPQIKEAIDYLTREMPNQILPVKLYVYDKTKAAEEGAEKKESQIKAELLQMLSQVRMSHSDYARGIDLAGEEGELQRDYALLAAFIGEMEDFFVAKEFIAKLLQRVKDARPRLTLKRTDPDTEEIVAWIQEQDSLQRGGTIMVQLPGKSDYVSITADNYKRYASALKDSDGMKAMRSDTLSYTQLQQIRSLFEQYKSAHIQTRASKEKLLALPTLVDLNGIYYGTRKPDAMGGADVTEKLKESAVLLKDWLQSQETNSIWWHTALREPGSLSALVDMALVGQTIQEDSISPNDLLSRSGSSRLEYNIVYDRMLEAGRRAREAHTAQAIGFLLGTKIAQGNRDYVPKDFARNWRDYMPDEIRETIMQTVFVLAEQMYDMWEKGKDAVSTT